jgi:hypothetical protein
MPLPRLSSATGRSSCACAGRSCVTSTRRKATFLVLAQKAKSLCVQDLLGPWIHSVAYRIASCARAGAIRRQRHTGRHGDVAAARLTVYQDEDQKDLEVVVHEEIDRRSTSAPDWSSVISRVAHTNRQRDNLAGRSARSRADRLVDDSASGTD